MSSLLSISAWKVFPSTLQWRSTASLPSSSQLMNHFVRSTYQNNQSKGYSDFSLNLILISHWTSKKKKKKNPHLSISSFCPEPIYAFSSVQFSHLVVSDFATPWTAARQASLSITSSWSLLKLMSIELVMPSNHLILCCPLLLLALSLSQNEGLQLTVVSTQNIILSFLFFL